MFFCVTHNEYLSDSHMIVKVPVSGVVPVKEGICHANPSQ